MDLQGDWATDLCCPVERSGVGSFRTTMPQVSLGGELVAAFFKQIDASVLVEECVPAGQSVPANTEIVRLSGSLRSILRAEKLLLSVLRRMSSVTTQTRACVELLSDSTTQLIEARDYTPGFRLIEKAAMALGGARSHRFGLSETVMLTTNHIAAIGGIEAAFEALRESLSPTVKIEIEISDMYGLQKAIDSGADLIRLLGFSFAEAALAVRTNRGRCYLEYDGCRSSEMLIEIAKTGIDFISGQFVLNSGLSNGLTLSFER